MSAFIEQAKVMSKGQITLPAEIRKVLGVSTGDHVSFIVKDDSIIIVNSAIAALRLLQNQMKGKAKKMGFKGEEDVYDYMDKQRASLKP